MPDAFDFCVLALATWRLAVFLVREEGPWGLARHVREWAGIDHDDAGTPVGIPDSMPGAALGCVWCTSAWLSPVMLGLWLSGPGMVVVLVLGLAGAAVIVEVVAGRLQT